MSRAAAFVRRAWPDPVFRVSSAVGALVVWVAMAWADPRILVALLVIAAVLAVRYRRSPPEERVPELDDEEWL